MTPVKVIVGTGENVFNENKKVKVIIYEGTSGVGKTSIMQQLKRNKNDTLFIDYTEMCALYPGTFNNKNQQKTQELCYNGLNWISFISTLETCKNNNKILYCDRSPLSNIIYSIIFRNDILEKNGFYDWALSVREEIKYFRQVLKIYKTYDLFNWTRFIILLSNENTVPQLNERNSFESKMERLYDYVKAQDWLFAIMAKELGVETFTNIKVNNNGENKYVIASVVYLFDQINDEIDFYHKYGVQTKYYDTSYINLLAPKQENVEHESIESKEESEPETNDGNDECEHEIIESEEESEPETVLDGEEYWYDENDNFSSQSGEINEDCSENFTNDKDEILNTQFKLVYAIYNSIKSTFTQLFN